ncbi:hypothetical protein [Actinoplanes sp. HUAS TT8]|uniref:hypothetical protein n=1 Tax=Actinoplanes sp. HUAS TT8 TaxID=3447453 RepID=UPI003F521278
MRKRLAAMIAVLPIAGMVAACADTERSGGASVPPAATGPVATEDVGFTPSASSSVTSRPPAPHTSATGRPVIATSRPATERPRATPTTPALPPYRPPTVGKPIYPTDPLTPPPPITAGPDDPEQRVQEKTPAVRQQKPPRTVR